MKIKSLLVIAIIVISFTSALAETVDTAWVRTYDLGNSGGAKDFAINDSGYVFVVGQALDDPNPPFKITIKYNSDGDTVWTREYENYMGFNHSIAVDSIGNVCIGGTHFGDEEVAVKYHPNGAFAWAESHGFGWLVGGVTRTEIDASGNVIYSYEAMGWDSYALIKYDSLGDEQWAKESDWIDYFSDLGIDNSGNIFVTGDTYYEIATVKYLPNGDTAWTRKYGNPAYENTANSIVVDDLGNAYITGCEHIDGTTSNAVTIKYDSDGDTAMVFHYGNIPNDSYKGYDNALDADNNLYVVGYHYASDQDIITIKYRPNGDTAWVRTYDGIWKDEDIAHRVAVSNDGNVFVNGTINDGTPASLKYDSTGTLLWIKTHDFNVSDIAVDNSGSYYVFGNNAEVLTLKRFRYVSTIDTISPWINALNVPVNTDISITFDDDMDASSINDTTFKVHAQMTGLHSGIISYDAPSKTVTFDPDNDFAIGEVVTVTITDHVLSELGYPLSKSYIWQFTTEVSSGVFSFPSNEDFIVGDSPEQVIAVDINNDNLIDLITCNSGEDSIGILINTGSGSFAEHDNYPTGTSPHSLHALDINSDGFLDIVTTNIMPDSISVLINNTSGGFLPKVDYESIDEPRSIEVADFNIDGHIDLVIANAISQNICFYYNNGNGTFSPFEEVLSEKAYLSIAVGDIDNDGDPDFVGCDLQDSIGIMENVGGSNFDYKKSLSVGGLPVFVTMADVNNDSKIDILNANGLGGSISIVFNLGEYVFSTDTTYPAFKAWDICPVDFNADGYLDLVVGSNNTDANIYLFSNNSDGIFTPIDGLSVGGAQVSIASADLDNDGDMDLATCDNSSNYVKVFWNEEIPITIDSISPTQNELNVAVDENITIEFGDDINTSTLNDTTIVVHAQMTGLHTGSISYDAPSHTVTFDPDNDFAVGEVVTVIVTDKVYSTQGGPLEQSYVWQFTTEVHDGYANFSQQTTISMPQVATHYGITAAELNNDNLLDLVVPIVLDSVTVLLNNGNRQFDITSYDLGLDYPNDAKASDLDKDGYMDIFACMQNTAELEIIMNEGDGTFGGFIEYPTYPGGDPYYVASDDFNGDGHIDIAVTNHHSDEHLVVYFNDGDGTFDDSSYVDNGTSSPFTIVPADLDNDFDLDLIIANDGAHVVHFECNDGTGTFEFLLNQPVGKRPHCACVADFNGDGLNDVAVANTGDVTLEDSTVTVLRNNGDSTFSQMSNFYVGQRIEFVYPADLDNDGDLDLAVMDNDSDSIFIVKNNGGWNFSKYASYPTDNRNNRLLAADLDNDGDMDLAAAGFLSDNVNIYYNEPPDVYMDTTVIDSADLYFILSADLDRDNYMDIVYTGSVTSGLFVSYGDPIDTLTDPENLLEINQAAIGIGYIDTDTLLDIVAVNSDSAYILLNQGSRLFTSSSILISNYTGVPSVALGYLDDDVYLDIISAPDNLHTGDGTGDFTGSTLSFSFESVNISDFDYDGIDDLLITGDDSVKIYINDGSADFTQTASEFVGAVSLEIPPSSAVTDFNRDQNVDFALVQPLAGPSTESVICIGLGDGAGDLLQYSTITVSGDAYDLVATDVNRDNQMDIVISNGTVQRLEIYLGDGIGGFAEPEFVALPTDDDMTFVLSTLDLNRDGNPDYISGGPDGDNLIAAIDKHPATTESLDEMVVSGYNGINLEIINPAGFVISRIFQTVAGADYWVSDINADGILDEESYDYNLMYGNYIIIIRPGTSDDVGYFDAGVRVNGSAKAVIFDGYNNFPVQKYYSDRASDSIVFIYPVEQTPSVLPMSGQPVGNPQPTFNWSGASEKYFASDSFHFQISNYHDFSDTIEQASGLLEPSYTLIETLDTNRVYYWHYSSYSGGIESDYSITYALYIVSYLCGDANADGSINVSDAVWIINYVFIGGDPPDPVQAGDANCDGTCNISDAVWIINYVFVGGNAPCDTEPPSPNGDGVPDC